MADVQTDVRLELFLMEAVEFRSEVCGQARHIVSWVSSSVAVKVSM
jgi:hypothetical protein